MGGQQHLAGGPLRTGGLGDKGFNDLAKLPAPADAYALEARGLLMANDHVAAEKALRRVLELSPDHPAERLMLAGLLAEKGRTEDAAAQLHLVAPELADEDAVLHTALTKYIAARGENYEKKVESKILTDAAPYLSDFVGRLFGITAERADRNPPALGTGLRAAFASGGGSQR